MLFRDEKLLSQYSVRLTLEREGLSAICTYSPIAIPRFTGLRP